MKKLTVGLAVLLSGYAANSFAALPTGVSSRCDVCVPSYCGGFTFGLTGLYWRPTASHLDYALTFPAFDSAGGFLFTDGHHHSVDHDYDWGWKANIGYVFPCSGNDVNLTYTHWDNDDHDRADRFAFAFPGVAAPFFDDGFFPVAFPAFPAAIAITGLVGAAPFLLVGGLDVPAFTFLVDPADLVAISARSNFQNNTWDLDFGQTINVGCNFKLRWFGGLRYSTLKHSLDVTHDYAFTDGTVAAGTIFGVVTTVAIGTVAIGGTLATVDIAPVFDVTGTLRDIAHQKSDFNGIGPRFGFDASYHLGGGFGVVGSISTALLVGEIDSTFSERIETAITSVALDPALTTVDVLGVVGEVITGVAIAADPLVPVATLETISFRHPDETRVVPNIDAKIGLDWTYQFCNCSRSKLTIEAGYMVSHYFNAIDRLSAVEAIAPEARSRQTIDVSFDGPYIGVQVNL